MFHQMVQRMAESEKPGAGPRVAMLAGASGFVGGELLKLLLEAPDYSRTHAISRRPLPFDHARLANRILPLEQVRTRLAGVQCHDAFCCIGSTRRAAGSDAELRRVDVALVLEFARAVREGGAQRFVVLSSVGADAASRHAYLRNKAEMEAALAELRFPALDILRPGLLLGWRGELRPAELAGSLLMPLLNPLLAGRFAQYRGIAARDAAAAMLGAARSRRLGVCLHAGQGLVSLAEAGRRPLRNTA
jgi:uncharacterized protein YbjT (DUF2867 family)